MRHGLIAATALALAAAVWAAGTTTQSAPATRPTTVQAVPPSPPSPEVQAMTQRWLAAAAPGPRHKELDPFVGAWRATVKTWTGGPGSQPIQTAGTSTVKWVLDGRFLLEEFTGKMIVPTAGGQSKAAAYQGMGLTGYDNTRNLYVSTWADTTSTAILNFAGSRDPAGKVFTFYGQVDDPTVDVHGRTVKTVTRVLSKDKHTLEMYDLHAGDDFKVLEILYERQ